MSTFGETLKRERELRKITLREVSEATKIGLRYLEALEANRFDQLPGGLFNKGFIRAYAKFIGLDGEALVNAYLFDLNSQQNPPVARPRYTGFSLEETAPPVPPVEKKAAPRTRRWILAGGAAAAVLAVAAGLWIFRAGTTPARQKAHSQQETDRAAVAPGPIPSTVSPPAPASSAPGAPAPSTQGAGDGGAPQETSATAAPANGPVPETAPARDETGGQDASEAQKAASAPESLSLVLTASEQAHITLSCEGAERLDQDIFSGESVRQICREEIGLSSDNVGALTLQINGNDCLPLGERGSAVKDFVFNRSRVKELCPPSPPERP